MLLIYHVTSQNHLLKHSCIFMAGSSSYITFLIYQMTWKDHVFKGLCDFMGGSPSQEVTIFPCSTARGFVVVEYIIYSVT